MGFKLFEVIFLFWDKMVVLKVLKYNFKLEFYYTLYVFYLIEACIYFRIMNILEMVQVGRYYYNPKTPSAVPQHR